MPTHEAYNALRRQLAAALEEIERLKAGCAACAERAKREAKAREVLLASDQEHAAWCLCERCVTPDTGLGDCIGQPCSVKANRWCDNEKHRRNAPREETNAGRADDAAVDVAGLRGRPVAGQTEPAPLNAPRSDDDGACEARGCSQGAHVCGRPERNAPQEVKPTVAARVNAMHTGELGHRCEFRTRSSGGMRPCGNAAMYQQPGGGYGEWLCRTHARAAVAASDKAAIREPPAAMGEHPAGLTPQQAAFVEGHPDDVFRPVEDDRPDLRCVCGVTATELVRTRRHAATCPGPDFRGLPAPPAAPPTDVVTRGDSK